MASLEKLAVREVGGLRREAASPLRLMLAAAQSRGNSLKYQDFLSLVRILSCLLGANGLSV